jgi:triphosphoribosyl-dephospho-CoA synthetase
MCEGGNPMTEEQKAPQSEISDELRGLGQRLREAVVTAQESQQAQEFRQELKRGITELRQEIEELLESEEVQRLGESVREAVQEVSQGDVGQQIRKGILAALKELNARIGQVIQEAEKAGPAEGTPPKESSS